MMKKFGEMLTSRPAGREAYLVAQAYVLPTAIEEIIVDFEGVKVLTPSWADEFITRLVEEHSDQVAFQNTGNPSVKATLAVLGHTSADPRRATS